MALKVEIVAAAPRNAAVVTVELPEGATVRDALAAAGLAHRGAIGIFGERVAPESRLSDGDRVELYRPLALDPTGPPRNRGLRFARRRV